MTVGEILDILSQVDRDRQVYVPDYEGKAEMVAAIIDLKHLHLPDGISIPDDVALVPASILEQWDDEDTAE